MVKLLYVGDYSNTGFGTVAKGLLRGLHATGRYEITQLGINFTEYDKSHDPWRIVPAGKAVVKDNRMGVIDPYGVNQLDDLVREFDPDILFVNNDYPIAKNYMERDGEPTFAYEHRSLKVLYAPVDSEPAPKSYAVAAGLYDLNIAYSEWQKLLMAEHDPLFSLMPVLYHGYDDRYLRPMDKQEAKTQLVELLAEKAGADSRGAIEERILGNYLVYFVGTNQFRKDIPCLFRAFALFHEEYPDTVLLPHTNNLPMGQNGWVLKNLQVLTELENAIIMGNANVFTEEEMNVFYNAADVLAYPTRGEGFGLPSLEAMAVKTPVIATNFGPQSELHARGRGYMIEILDVIPGDIAAWSYFVLPDYRSLYRQLKHVYSNPEDVANTVETAYEWAKDFTWTNQARQLDEILQKLPTGGRDASLVQA